jgi:hypothetical protein
VLHSGHSNARSIHASNSLRSRCLVRGGNQLVDFGGADLGECDDNPFKVGVHCAVLHWDRRDSEARRKTMLAEIYVEEFYNSVSSAEYRSEPSTPRSCYQAGIFLGHVFCLNHA